METGFSPLRAKKMWEATGFPFQAGSCLGLGKSEGGELEAGDAMCMCTYIHMWLAYSQTGWCEQPQHLNTGKPMEGEEGKGRTRT